MKNPSIYFANTGFNCESIDSQCTNPPDSLLPTLTDLLYEYEKDAPVTLQKISEKQTTRLKNTESKRDDLSQKQIIEQFKKHMTAKNRTPDPLLDERGYCLGLTSVWLARMARNEGRQFESELTSIVKLTKKEIEILPDRIDTPIERLFNLLQWAQQSGKLLKIPQINPLEIDNSFISTLSLTLTGTPNWCANLLCASEPYALDSVPLTPKHTLVLLRFFSHAAAAYRNEEGLWFYDPNCKTGAELMQSLPKLSEALWKANGGGEHLTFSVDLYVSLQRDCCNGDQHSDLSAPDHLATLMAEEMEFSGFINSSDVNGYTALLNASKQGHSQAVKAFLDFGADVNKASNHGVTPLVIAAIKNHIGIVKTLIDHGADLNKTDNDGATPLWVAAQNGHIEIVQTLIDAGADVHKVDNKGISALLAAEKNGYSTVADILREAGLPHEPNQKES